MKVEEIRRNYSAVIPPDNQSRLVPLSELTALKVDQSGPSSSSEFTYIDISSVDNKLKRITDPKHLASDAAPSRAKQRLKAGDVLVSMTRPNLNAVAIVPPECDGAVGSTGFHVLRASEDTEPRWLYYAVQTKEFVSAMSELVQGALYPAVRPKDIRAFEIPHPPLDQQKRIVAEIEKQFSRLDEAVANLKRVKANLKRYKAAVLKAAVEGRLVETEAERARREGRSYETGEQLLQRILETRRSQWQGKGKYKEPAAPDTTDLPELPEGWVWATVEQLAFVDVGYAFKSNEFEEKGIRLLRGENIEPGRLRWDDTRYWPEEKLDNYRSLLVQEGEIVLAMDRPIVTAGLKLARAQQADIPCLLVQRMARMRCTSREMEGYLYAAMQTHRFERHLLGGQTGTQLPHISGSGIASFVVPLPPASEQRSIVAEVERRLSLLHETETQVDSNRRRAERLRQSVLQRAFSIPSVSNAAGTTQ